MGLVVFFHSLHARIKTVSLIKNELEEKPTPRRVVLETVVKLRRNRPQLRQIVPRNGRQIVVLVVITHVQRQQINRPVIAERLLIEIIRVMLLNPASAYRVQPNGKQKREHQIEKSGPTAEINDRYIIRDRACKID